MSKRNLIIIFILLIGTVIAWITPIDLAVSNYFYDNGWIHQNEFPWPIIKDWGVWPPNSLGILALLVLIIGFFKKSFARFRRQCLFLVVVILIGPGLIVNSIFKENYGRPRPRQIQQFNGEKQFKKAWVYSNQNGHSFPSGHSSIAFYFISLYYVLRRNRKKIANWCFFGGIAYGILMSFTRIIQGAHFFSDCLWAFGFVWLTCELADRWILNNPKLNIGRQ